MALMVNPSNGTGTDGRDRRVGVGRKVLMPVGIDHRESRAGNQMAVVRFICLKDLDSETNEDRGAYAWDTFVLTERALWKIAKYAVAVGHHEPFDAENEGEFQKVLTARPVLAEMQTDKDREGEDRIRPSRYSKYAGEPDEDWDGLIESGEERHAEYRKWKDSQSSGYSAKPASAVSASDDEIPF